MARTMAPIPQQMDVFRMGTSSIEPEEVLQERLEEDRPLRIKLGVDPTSADLHLGHMVPIQKLRALQDLGHEIVFIIGSYTARIGDPTGRNRLRPALDAQEVEGFASTYREQVLRVLDGERTRIVDNADWIGELTMEDLLKLCAKVTVARTLERDDFSKRYAKHQPIHLHEFLYPVMQGYDSVVLQPDVEIGGSDQRFNILAARDLMSQHGQRPQVALFLPLLSGLDGSEKMSKSAGNAVGITETPLDMLSKILSIDDEAMKAWWPLVSNQSPEQVRSVLEGLDRGSLHPKDAKKDLARAIVAVYHGGKQAAGAIAEWESLHERRSKEAPADTPELLLSEDALQEGSLSALDLVAMAEFSRKERGQLKILSRGAIRRLMDQGGLYLDDLALRDPTQLLSPHDGAILRMSRKQFRRLRRSP